MLKVTSLVWAITILQLSVVAGSAYSARSGVGLTMNHKTEMRARIISSDMITEKQRGATQLRSLGFESSPNAIVGTTYLDCQQVGSMGHQIATGGGWVHNIFTYLPGPSTANSTAFYQAYIPAQPPVENPDINGSFSTGSTNISTVSGRAVVAFHSLAQGGTLTGADFAVAAGAFSMFLFPTTNCQGIVTGTGVEGPYLWPKLATAIYSGNPVAHVVATEGPANAGEPRSLVYFRSNNGITASGFACGQFIDSVPNASAVIVADPNSPNVAIVYVRPVDFAFSGSLQQKNNTVVYRMSQDMGLSWGPITEVSGYNSGSIERAYTDVAAIFTSEGCLHIAWNAVPFDAVSGKSSDQQCKLRHWDDCAECMSLAFDANYEDKNYSRGIWNLNIAKMNLTECDGNLYLTYTRFPSTPAIPDGSIAGFANGDIFAQASNSGGISWGPAVNLTGTTIDNCVAGNCPSEHWSSSALYVNGNLEIQYIADKDPGSVVHGEGSWQPNPVMNLSHSCFAVELWHSIKPTPAEFKYPLYVAPGGYEEFTITLLNEGNEFAPWSVTDIANGLTITFPNGNSGVCPFGCNNTSTLVIGIQGPATEGLYTDEVIFSTKSPDKNVSILTSIPIELYCFTNFYLPQDAVLRTNTNRFSVNQASQIGTGGNGKMFSYFADSTNYLSDGYLIIGNSAVNLSYSVFDNDVAPTPSNPFGFLYAATADMNLDSTSSASYRRASGIGANRDTTIGFTADWYASKHPDSADFYVGAFRVYKGPKNPTGSMSGLRIAYFTDWDIPSDSGIQNTAGSDPMRSAIWQTGTHTAPNSLRYGATAAYRNDGSDIIGGWVLDNPTYIYPEGVYENDSIWNITQILAQGQYRLYSGTPDDLSGGVLIYRNVTINGASNDTLKFVVVIAGTRNGGLTGINTALDKARNWICDHNLAPGADICVTCLCGDADNTGIITISDAVYLINYIFAGGSAPAQLCLGDADGNSIITISDAVFLINYIFAGGPAPFCP